MSKKNAQRSIFDPSTTDHYNPTAQLQLIDKQLRKDQFLSQLLLLAVFCVLCFVFVQSRQVEVDYIDGNVVYVGNDGGSPGGNFLTTPWRNASLYNTLLFSTLFLTDSTYTEVNPHIATDYKISSDGLTYTIGLREDFCWSDGVPITVEDIIFSFEAFLSCEFVNSYLTSAFCNIEGASSYMEGEAESIAGLEGSGNQLTITLEEPHAGFSLMLTQFAPLPEHILGDLDQSTLTSDISFFTDLNVISSGAFQVDSFDLDGNLILTQNPYYPKEQTDIEKFVLLWDFENVELDYYTTTDPTKMISYRSMKGFEEYMVDVLFYRYFLFNTEKSPDGESHKIMQDVRVRQAIYHAIDVEALLNEVYFGKGSVYYGGYLPFAQEEYPYDPDLARALLEEAGYDFQRVFQIIYYSGDKSSQIFLERVKSYLEEVGLTVELRFVTTTGEIYDEGNHDLLMKNLSAFNVQDWYSEYLSSNVLMSKVLGDCSEFDRLYEELNEANSVTEFERSLQDLVDYEQEILYKIPMFTIGEAVYINGNRLSVPEDIVFGNTRYFSDIRLEEWFVKQE